MATDAFVTSYISFLLLSACLSVDRLVGRSCLLASLVRSLQQPACCRHIIVIWASPRTTALGRVVRARDADRRAISVAWHQQRLLCACHSNWQARKHSSPCCCATRLQKQPASKQGRARGAEAGTRHAAVGKADGHERQKECRHADVGRHTFVSKVQPRGSRGTAGLYCVQYMSCCIP